VVELILGGVRSGKSREARRIECHRTDRPEAWQTIEESYLLSDRLPAESRPDHCLIVDRLTLWLNNWLLKGDEGYAAYVEERHKLLAALATLPGHTILVSNETNQGVIPASALSRQFCDEAGQLHQSLAAICDRVSLMVAGIAMDVKTKGDR